MASAAISAAQDAGAADGRGRVDDPLEVLPPDEVSVRELLHAAGEGAKRLETDHFVVVYTSAEQPARDLAERLEAVYRAHVRFMRELKVPARRPRHKLEVCFFGRYAEFQAHLETLGTSAPDVLGCYEPPSNRCAFFDLDMYPPIRALRETLEPAEPEQREKLRQRLERRRAALGSRVIQHEAAHQIQLNLGLIPSFEQVPAWLAEGLAMLFEVPFERSGEPRQAVNAYRLYEFRKLYGGGRQTLGDVRQLLADDQAWCGSRCYPWAWAITCYLRDEHRAGFAALLRKAATEGGLPKGSSARRALLDELFGPLDDKWLDRFYAQTMGLRLDATALEE